MPDYITYALSVFMGFFAMLNPLADTPMFLSVTEGQTPVQRKMTAKTACLVSFAVTLAFIILGKYIFELFKLTIPAFKVTGGILMFCIGFEMLMSKKSDTQSTHINVSSHEDVAITPLAVPILAGPGMIVTSMNYVTNADFIHILIVVGMLILITYLNYLAFILSKSIIKALGKSLISVVGKMMGLILAIIGTGMTTEGIKLSFNLM